MFEKIRRNLFGKAPSENELSYNKEVSNFPPEHEGTKVTRQEFRRIIEELKPNEIFARYHRMDDFGAHGTFYLRFRDNSLIRIDDYYPSIDAEGNITKTISPLGVLDNLPYREILHKFHQSPHPLYFKAKYVLID